MTDNKMIERAKQVFAVEIEGLTSPWLVSRLASLVSAPMPASPAAGECAVAKGGSLKPHYPPMTLALQ